MDPSELFIAPALDADTNSDHIVPGTMPFIHQVCDTPDEFDGRHACGATSAVMIAAYYQRLSPWPIYCSHPYTHISNFGAYVSRIYEKCGYTFNCPCPDASGVTAYGAYGYIHDASTHNANKYYAAYFFQKHGIKAIIDNSPSISEVQSEINKGHPVWASTIFWGGHLVVIKGYSDDGTFIVNDPWPEGYSQYTYIGENRRYTWTQMGTETKYVIYTEPWNAGDSVKPTVPDLNCHVAPDINAPEVSHPNYPGHVPADSIGVIQYDSTYGSPWWNKGGYTWWKISWDKGFSGWCAFSTPASGGTAPTYYLEKIPSQICNLAGNVLDATNNNPILNASISITVGGKSFPTTTNASGYYSFSDIPAGSCQATVQASGYQTWQETFTLIANQTNIKNFRLTPIQASWVFLYYMSNGNDSRLEDSITKKFKQVAQGCANPNVKAYFLWDHFSGQDGVYSMTTNQDWTTYKEGVNFWPPPLAGISSQWELNMGDPATLKNFILWVLAREGTNRNYALVIFDHGNGIYSEAEIRREEPSGICFEGSDNYLSVKELGDAVGYFANLNHRPIGVLHLDACLMQMMEVNYQLRSSCDYLVASENEGWSGCYEYYYLSTVQSNSQPRELAEKIALAYFGWLIDNDRPGTVSVTRPGETNRVLNAINGFSIALWNNMDKLRALDGVIRDHVQKFAYPNIYNTDDTNNWFVDLEDFCYEIKEHVGDAQLANQAQAVLDALGIPGGNFILLERHRSKDYYDPDDRKWYYYHFDKGTYGISILLPPSSANPSHYTSENFEFCRDSYWDEFIKAYTSTARLKLTTPEGGTWKVGEVCPITWTYANLSGYLSIQLSRDGGNTYSEPIADSVPVVNGRWDWTVTGSASSSCKIRIQSLSYSYICDISDQIFSISAPSNPIISLTPSSLSFTCLQGSSPPSQTLQIRNSGGGTLNWTVSDNATWLTVNPASGSSTGEWDPVTVSVNASSLSPGPYTAKITVSAPEASNSPQYVPVSLTVASPNLPSPIVESNIPQSGTVNQPLTFSISLTNLGGTAEHGGISVSFPELDQISSTSMPPYSSTKGDVIATSTQGLTVSYYDKGDAISKYPPGSGSIPAQHLLVEATYGSWGNGVSKVLNFTLTPKVEGTYRIRFRGWLTTSGYSNYYGDPNSGIVDQQGYFVYESQIRVTSVPKGTISVQANITAPFTLNGPNSLVLTGTTPWQRSDLDPGNYTVNWGSVSGYISPPSETKTLPSGGSITFMGNYTQVTPVPKGTVSVQANITAPFTLNGPNSLVLTGTTPWQRSDLDPGNYTVNWGSVSGYISPPSETKTLPSGGSITFMGNYTLIPQNGTWTNMNPTAFPSARYMHAMTYDTSRKKVVLFGGFSETEGYLNDLWSYSFSSNSWSKLNATNPPPGRVSPAIAYDPTKDRIIIFGGGSPGIDLDDTWAYYYSTGRWEKLNPSTHPSPRSDAQMVYDSSTQKIILFGGHGSVLFGDTWAFDCQTDNWVNLLPLNGPTARYDFGMAYDSVRHRVIIFGGLTGWDYNSAKNDTWAYDPSTNSWSNLNPSSPPSARANHALSFDSLNDKIILFGGFQNTFLNETWAYNPATNSWIKLSPEGPLPPARGYFPMAYDSAYNRTVLFGGYNGQLLSDTWTFNIGGTPSRFTLNYTVTPSGSGSVTLNPPPDADGKYASGTNVILTANPNSGFTFSHWSGSVSGTANPINVIMNEDKQVTANFMPISQPTISFTPTSFTFTAVQGGANPSPQTLKIRNGGGGTLN
jgi:hypothetical protein